MSFLPAAFKNRATLLVTLGSHLASGQIALFLGAGVSKAFQFPTWKELLARMYERRGKTKWNRKDDLAAAEAYYAEFRKGDDAGFKQDIHDALYQGAIDSFADMQRNALLAAIGALVISSVRGKASLVVSFNFDDLLERYLRYNGLIVSSVHTFPSAPVLSDVTVLHPHGFLPCNKPAEFSNEVILKRSDYLKIIRDPLHPQTQEITTIMRKYMCLFVGLSGEDYHLEALLQAAADNQAILKAGTARWGVTFDTKPAKLGNAWELNKISHFKIDQYEPDLQEFLLEICQSAAAERERRG